MTVKEEMGILASNRVKKIKNKIKKEKALKEQDAKRGYLVRKDPARVGVLLCHIL